MDWFRLTPRKASMLPAITVKNLTSAVFYRVNGDHVLRAQQQYYNDGKVAVRLGEWERGEVANWGDRVHRGPPNMTQLCNIWDRENVWP